MHNFHIFFVDADSSTTCKLSKLMKKTTIMPTSYNFTLIEVQSNSTEVNQAVKIKSECKQVHKNSSLSLDLPCILLLLFSLYNHPSKKEVLFAEILV